MSGWQNVLLSKCLGAKISCSHNFWVSKRGVSKCPGVEMLDAKMSENPRCWWFDPESIAMILEEEEEHLKNRPG